MSNPNPDKLKVLWQKGRNYFSSFYVELGDARNEIRDDKKFASWCVTDLRIGLDTLTSVSKVLKKADADVVKRELANARDADRTERRAKKAAERKEREEERARQAIEKAQKKEEMRRNRKQQAQKKYRKRKKDEQLALYAASAKPNGNAVTISDAGLDNFVVDAYSRRNASRQQWIDASIDLAIGLRQGRIKYPANPAFGEWLGQLGIDIAKDDQAALLNMATNLDAMRQILNQTERSSYRYIWKEAQIKLSSP
jgi:hypothetical protein